MSWTPRVCPAAFNANLGPTRVWNGGIFPCLFLVLFSSLLLGQTGESQQQVSPDTTVREPRSFQASRVDRAPKLDGTLDDPLWREAKPITNFLQREPFEGQPPTERTEVRVLYTKHAVYFGITCFDSDEVE